MTRLTASALAHTQRTVRRTDAAQAFLDLMAERGKQADLLNVMTDELVGYRSGWAATATSGSRSWPGARGPLGNVSHWLSIRAVVVRRGVGTTTFTGRCPCTTKEPS